MYEIYDSKEKKYVMVLETEDGYVSQEDWDKYNWSKIQEDEEYLWNLIEEENK